MGISLVVNGLIGSKAELQRFVYINFKIWSEVVLLFADRF